jgi:hypothetical protein
VFAPGKLVVFLFNRSGAITSQREVGVVDPAKETVLDTTVPSDQGASRVSVKLFDAQGRDRGSLSVAKIAAQ